ncbi:hypothetical protein GQ464_006945 [Rhodocaloribacter litoris]|uniref:hypothetical protein n=1 Tax=Rhodocaloribacter litoris TaxID=2558931 RepID=UPI001420F061|nr:hypothetical protein [Rhodocaloribacter litoris]QXD16668.1 hypothetical protein GQ464_006945 [Rhodocaloribacter litoris]
MLWLDILRELQLELRGVNTMKKCILLSYLAIFAAYVPNVAAQFASPCNTVDLEIMLAVEEVEGVWVSVTNLENKNIVYSDVVFSDDNVHQNCDWVANVGGVSSGITGAVDLEDNTLYKIEIGTYVFAYFGCEPGFDLFGEVNRPEFIGDWVS